MSELRVAIIGGGHLGFIHTKLIRTLPGVKLIGMADPSPQARSRIGGEFDLPTTADYRTLLTEADAAIVAAPTTLHHEICRDVLLAGAHVLVEKPMALNSWQASDLVALADQRNLTLQVGHVERYNPALAAVRDRIGNPFYIDAVRTSGYTFRSADIGVVMDLMIHDIDLVLSLCKSEIVDVRALGISVFGGNEDMAQARLEFSNGCVANLQASRSSFAAQRSMQLITDCGYVKLDMAGGEAVVVSPHQALQDRAIDFSTMPAAEQANVRDALFEEWLPKQSFPGVPCNAILEEQKEFLAAIRQGIPPRITGADGRDAVAVAERVLQQIEAHHWGENAPTIAGPHVSMTELQQAAQSQAWPAESMPQRKAG